ncbi:hypothetical protein MTsN3n11_12190 [Qipengyuania sp. MTN3-11]
MDKFEYVVALAAVITGLGLSDVAVSLHRLLKRRAGVVWDWLPITLALYASMVLMRLWYQLWSVREVPVVTGLPFVAVVVVQTLLLVLVMSAALPDEDDFKRGRVDLRAYYATQSRYIWSMYLLFVSMWIATHFYFEGPERLIELDFYAFFLMPLVLTAVAVVVARRWQAVILGFLVLQEAVIKWDFFGLWG